MVPVGLILTINLVIFVLVTYRLTCGRWEISANKNADLKERRSENWRLFNRLISLTLLLGLTWVFGFLAIGGARFFFNVLFLIFNSLQGLFIFLMFGVRQEPVREQWLKLFNCCRCKYKKMDGRRSNSGSYSNPTKSMDSGIKMKSSGTSDVSVGKKRHDTTTTSLSS